LNFVSIAFLIFFIIVFSLYCLFQKNVKIQNWIILIASFVFYGWWDWRFLGLLAFTAGVDFVAGLYMEKNRRHAKKLLVLSLVINLGMLFVFKYYNFFVNNFHELLSSIGIQTEILSLQLILPWGISFYTFQSISYSIEIYRKEIKAEESFVDFLAFVSFFPHLVAGPIQRATNLLPQIKKPRELKQEKIKSAVWLIVWGYFVKMFVGDTAAGIANSYFVESQIYGWSTFLGVIAFSLQIYGDFLGYSNIAKGVAQLFGIELIWNFNQPYFSVSIQDFWRRWHISLSSWLRDYLYIPLGGNRKGPRRAQINSMITMVLGGLWHGAAWNFIFWGFLHGLGLAVHKIWSDSKFKIEIPAFVSWIMTMIFVGVGWFFFRASSMKMIRNMLTAFKHMNWLPGHTSVALSLLLVSFPLFVIEVYQYKHKDQLKPASLSTVKFALLLGFMVSLCWIVSARKPLEFIYFQF
jgi:D-alanyl-lipoteichoic acid acyltransferase DltB (MBOAT superfamily)